MWPFHVRAAPEEEQITEVEDSLLSALLNKEQITPE